MHTRSVAPRAGLLILLTLSVLLLIPACGKGPAPSGESATIYGNVPAYLLPIPDGQVAVEVVPAADGTAQPVATFSVSTSHSGWFSVDVPPGTYVVRITPNHGVKRQSHPVVLAAGDDAEAHFAQL